MPLIFLRARKGAPGAPFCFEIPRRVHATGIHVLISALIALVAAAVVFGLWFPGHYQHWSGGKDIFLLLTVVDVTMGPFLTLVVFDTKKSRRILRRDLSIICFLQFGALIYGLSTVYQVRPVAMVFEKDRFRVITAAQVHLPELMLAQPRYRNLPLAGPWLLGTRESLNASERTESLFMALERGIDRAERPIFWQAYEDSADDALSRARPLSVLLERHPNLIWEIRIELERQKIDEQYVKFLPLVVRQGDWVALLDVMGSPFYFCELKDIDGQ